MLFIQHTKPHELIMLCFLFPETLADVTRYSSRRSISVMNGINVSGGADGPLPNVSITK